MGNWPPEDLFSLERFKQEAQNLLSVISDCKELEEARKRLYQWASSHEYQAGTDDGGRLPGELFRVRDTARAFMEIIKPYSDMNTGFSVTKALWDVACGRPREDLQAGFFAEMIHMVLGIENRSSFRAIGDSKLSSGLSGREASLIRSEELDKIWAGVEKEMARYQNGLHPEAVTRRKKRRDRILNVLGGGDSTWDDWNWQVEHVLTDAEAIASVVSLTAREQEVIARARQCKLPFGVTPYYASLMDEEASDRDRAVRAQVLPPEAYVSAMEKHRSDREHAFDFMGEHDTSPIDLVTRRYPAILILKPYNTCPQICVYCQRNWEIDEAMDPKALAPLDKIETAIQWIENHPAIREVLITGGDPLTLPNDKLREILTLVSRIPTVDVIRIGSRTPVTLPMRITQELSELLGSFRELGRREVCLVTHVEHPYEITPDLAQAVDRLKRQGINVFNQQVYTFFASRRFESASLRMLLRRVGIDPYYTFVAKGKEETGDYRVPIARLLQEQKEEARLLPGIRRTDEVVYNVPRLGKNHVRAVQHRDLVSVEPDGTRVYEFHPWEKNIVRRDNYIGGDVSILDYLSRLADIGENPDDYQSIWYYY